MSIQTGHIVLVVEGLGGFGHDCGLSATWDGSNGG